MALIFPDDGSNSPRTHVLIIGVGGYRHLAGGSEERSETLDRVGYIKQLTTPPRSAAAFAQWMVQAENLWAAPLGSVDLLTSVAPMDNYQLPNGLQSDLPTKLNIELAYDAWKARCNRHEDNIAIFYFCGHGVEYDQHILLAEDFGAAPNRAFAGSFAFDTTRLAFHGCRAKNQCFFIDSCREMQPKMGRLRPGALPLDESEYITECEVNLTLHAAARNELAFGPANDVSFFTKALIRALKGEVATPSGGDWVIETHEVAGKIHEILKKVEPEEGYQQRILPPGRTRTSTTLLRVAETPKVELELTCDPVDANPTAQLSCRSMRNPDAFNRQEMGAPWRIVVDAGFYIGEVQFDGGNYRNDEKEIMASPPFQPCKFWVYP